MILMIEAKKNIACGVEVFLVQLVNKKVEKKSIENILLVIEFTKVFVDDLPRIFPI